MAVVNLAINIRWLHCNSDLNTKTSLSGVILNLCLDYISWFNSEFFYVTSAHRQTT
uniref:Uncharacterized protein n=1 Tax=Kalanchoe fedtschenkoi TaxID=63787 RepID=A0A7N0UR17_KALFE